MPSSRWQLLFSLIGCGSSSEMESSLDSPETGGIRSIAVQLNWYPEAGAEESIGRRVEGIYQGCGAEGGYPSGWTGFTCGP